MDAMLPCSRSAGSCSTSPRCIETAAVGAARPRPHGVNALRRRLTWPAPRDHCTPRSKCRPAATGTSAAPAPLASAVADLSTYRWPARRPEVHAWLEACIQDCVAHLDEAPFLELVLPRAGGRAPVMERHQVPDSVLRVPQLWRSIAEWLGHSRPEVVVLVHPLDLPDEPGPLQQRAAAAHKVLTGISAHHAMDGSARLTNFGRLWETGVAEDILVGRFGDCCDDDDAPASPSASNIVPYHSGHHQHSQASSPSSASSAAHAQPGQPTHQERPHAAAEDSHAQRIQYWGVVVQSAHHSTAEGCYVLKTVRSACTADCQCTHYSLTRVSRGEPLAAQVAGSWLI